MKYIACFIFLTTTASLKASENVSFETARTYNKDATDELLNLFTSATLCDPIYLEKLLQKNADPNAKTVYDGSESVHLLHMATVLQNAEHVITTLVECNAHIDQKNKYYRETPLHRAVWFCDSHSQNNNAIETLLQLGASVNTIDLYNNTPFHYLLLKPDRNKNIVTAVARLLMQHGANIFSTNHNCETPYELALLHYDIDLTRILYITS